MLDKVKEKGLNVFNISNLQSKYLKLLKYLLYIVVGCIEYECN